MHEQPLCIKIGNGITSKSIKEAVWNIDAIETENECIKRKFKYYWDLIDIKARNAFSSKLVMSSLIKYANGLNHYSLRYEWINLKVMNAIDAIALKHRSTSCTTVK